MEPRNVDEKKRLERKAILMWARLLRELGATHLLTGKEISRTKQEGRC